VVMATAVAAAWLHACRAPGQIAAPLWWRRCRPAGVRAVGSMAEKGSMVEKNLEITRFARMFPSWQEHGGVAIFGVGMLNGCLVVVGFAITWLTTMKRYELDCKVQHLQSELARTDRQLEALFGPLRAITHATGVGFRDFMEQHRGAYSEAKYEARITTKPHSPDAKRYRQLVITMLQPLNRRAMELALSHTHLIDGDFPKCLYRFYSHVIEMDSVLERWRNGDFSCMFPTTQYPCEVNRWASEEFERLRLKQKRLLEELEGKLPQQRQLSGALGVPGSAARGPR